MQETLVGNRVDFQAFGRNSSLGRIGIVAKDRGGAS